MFSKEGSSHIESSLDRCCTCRPRSDSCFWNSKFSLSAARDAAWAARRDSLSLSRSEDACASCEARGDASSCSRSVLVVDFVLMVPEHVIEKRRDLPHGGKLTRSSMSVKI